MSKLIAITLSLIHLTVEKGQHGNKLTGTAPVKPKIIEIPNNRRVTFPDKFEDQYEELLEIGALRRPLPKEDVSVYPVFNFDNARPTTFGSATGRSAPAPEPDIFEADADENADADAEAEAAAEAERQRLAGLANRAKTATAPKPAATKPAATPKTGAKPAAKSGKSTADTGGAGSSDNGDGNTGDQTTGQGNDSGSSDGGQGSDADNDVV